MAATGAGADGGRAATTLQRAVADFGWVEGAQSYAFIRKKTASAPGAPSVGAPGAEGQPQAYVEAEVEGMVGMDGVDV